MCCQESSGQSPNPDDPNETAGFWGGLGTCDLPPVNLLESVLINFS